MFGSNNPRTPPILRNEKKLITYKEVTTDSRCLQWATAETAEEMAWCAARVEDLKWALKVRGAGAPFARQALRLLEREIGGLTVDYMKGPGVLDEREWIMEQDHAFVR